ncbi:MAG: matrixin family metalloprotease, partial [Planctomycetes bacterium]|nr:matrixin family metalloprotease [Planctomycetota bacterium]
AGHADGVRSLVVSPDGAKLYSGGDDKIIVAWNPNTGENLGTFTGHTGSVISLAISTDGATLLSGGSEGTAHVWDAAARTSTWSVAPCVSPINSIRFAPSGTSALVAIGARNQITLDTDPGNGGDLNLTYPVALSLKDAGVPNGSYFLWAEIETDRSEPARAYANATISVIDPFAAETGGAAPTVPFVNDEAAIVFAPLSFSLPDTRRQVVSLGSLVAGDRVFLSMMTPPSFGDLFTPAFAYSLALIDENNSISAWYESGGVLFSEFSRLVVGHSSARYYLVMDGGYGVKVRIQRGAGLNALRQQRVLVNFAGTGLDPVTIADTTTVVPPLNAANFNQYFVEAGLPNPNWGATETDIIKQSVVATLNAKYSGLNVVFVSSDQAEPNTPRLVMHVGGANLFAYGISDYIDPRNDFLSGVGITFASTIARDGINGFFANPTTAAATLGVAIGTVAAHEVGHLLGLRHTQGNPTDLMLSGADPTLGLGLTTSEVSDAEQVYGLPSIGIQDAPTLLLETIGPSN